MAADEREVDKSIAELAASMCKRRSLGAHVGRGPIKRGRRSTSHDTVCEAVAN